VKYRVVSRGRRLEAWVIPYFAHYSLSCNGKGIKAHPKLYLHDTAIIHYRPGFMRKRGTYYRIHSPDKRYNSKLLNFFPNNTIKNQYRTLTKYLETGTFE